METSVTADSVIRFLNHFEDVAMKEDFSLLEDMIDEQAYFRFNDGDFLGRKAIQAIFEKTWKGDPSVKKARFYLTEIVVLTTYRASATATYTYNWEGAQVAESSRFKAEAPACSHTRAASSASFMSTSVASRRAVLPNVRAKRAPAAWVDDQEGRYWWDNNWLMVAENKGSDYTSASGIEKIEE